MGAIESSGTLSAVRHFRPKMDGGFAGKPVIGLITLSTDCITEHELHLMAPADSIVVSATRIAHTRCPRRRFAGPDHCTNAGCSGGLQKARHH
jgi:hypothetical protein